MKPFAFLTIGATLSAASLLLVLLATVPSNAEQPPREAAAEAIPTDAGALFAYLKAGTYKSLTAQESAAHPSAGPHPRLGAQVRVFMNSTLDRSLAGGASEHPEGAGVVKELLSDAGELKGWAVAVKTEPASRNGEGWYWYEVKSTTDNRRPVANGKGVTLCSGCHSAGNDFVLSAYPLE